MYSVLFEIYFFFCFIPFKRYFFQIKIEILIHRKSPLIQYIRYYYKMQYILQYTCLH